MDRPPRLDIDIWRLCREQGGVVSRADLTAAGLDSDAIAHRVRTGRLWPWFGNGLAFAVGRPELSRPGVWRAALIAAGPEAALSHFSAAAIRELRHEGRGAAPHVSVPTQAGRLTPEGAVLHRCATLAPEDVEEIDGLRVTTLRRTFLDLSLVVSATELRVLLREAEYRHHIDLAELRRSIEEPRKSPRHGRLRRTLDSWVPGIGLTESELEARLYALCARRGIRLPEPQVRHGSTRPDFVWRAERLIVEVDGYEAHRGRIAFGDDRARDRARQADGYAVMRFTWPEVVAKPTMVARELKAALARRRIEVQSISAVHRPSRSTPHYDRAA
jgi:very-short-patch-repair endonuclease